MSWNTCASCPLVSSGTSPASVAASVAAPGTPPASAAASDAASSSMGSSITPSMVSTGAFVAPNRGPLFRTTIRR